MLSSEMTLPLANTKLLVVSQGTIKHLSAHPEVTEDVLETGASLLFPSNTQEASYIDLYAALGNWGKCALVKMDSVSLFAFRKDRKVPSAVTMATAAPASILVMVTKPIDNSQYELITAYCSDGTESTLEPISREIDPNTEEGRSLRQECLEFWSKHALSLDCTPIDGEPFESTWLEIIDKYGNYYQSL
jgi:hypothetical protein